MKGGPGFGAGLSSLWFGFGFLFRSPRSLPYAAVPAFVLFGLVTLSVAVSVSLVRPWAASWIGSDGTSGVGAWAGAALGWLIAIVAGLLGLLVSLVLAAPLSAPALEKLVTDVERSIHVPGRAEIGFFKEMWFGLKAQALAAMIAVPLFLLLWIVDLMFPPAIVVTLPLKLVVAAFSLAWNLLDYPLTLRGVKIRDRLRLFRMHKAATLGFGVSFAILFWTPCFQVLMLPIGVIGATRLVWQLLERSPEFAAEMGLMRSEIIQLPASNTPA